MIPLLINRRLDWEAYRENGNDMVIFTGKEEDCKLIQRALELIDWRYVYRVFQNGLLTVKMER
jgi:hypothetical protein